MGKNSKKEKRRRGKAGKPPVYKWVLIISLWAFILTLGMSSLAEGLMPKVSMISAAAILISFVFAGIIFDIIGVAVAVANPAPFHAMSAKKIKGAKGSLFLISHASKVSNFCNDVVGDIAGIVSGAAAVIIVGKLTRMYGFNVFLSTIILSSLVASLTIGGKGAGKSVALGRSFDILRGCGLLLYYIGFFREKRR